MNDKTAVAERPTAAPPMRASEVRDHVNLIQELLQSVMKANVHYGVIPGTKKPTLYKPGAEKILMMFQLAPKLRVEDLSSDGEVRYRITTDLESSSGRIVGTGIGEASSAEEKYAWREAVCDAEFDATPEARRRLKWKKGWTDRDDPTKDKAASSVKQVRSNVPDIANTILKMSAKRSLIHVTLTATAASDAFEQDLEDMPPELLQREAEREAGRHPGKEAGAKVDAEADPERRKKVIAHIEAMLKKGVALETIWMAMLKEDRTAVGKAEWERLRDEVKKQGAKTDAGATGAAGKPVVVSQGASGATAAAQHQAATEGAKTADAKPEPEWGEGSFDDVTKGREPGAEG